MISRYPFLLMAVIVLPAVFFGCFQPMPQHFSRDEISYIRRVPHSSHIEDGSVGKKGDFRISASVQGYSGQSQVHTFSESTFVSDEFSTITIHSKTYGYSTPVMVHGFLSIYVADNFATGLFLDANVGSKASVENIPQSLIDDVVIDFGWFLKAAASNGPFSVAFRPEFLFYSQNGRTSIIADSTNLSKSAFHKLGLTVRSIVAGRYHINKQLGAFFGAQHKVSPYSMRYADLTNKNVLLENQYSLYSGLGYMFTENLTINGYCLVPFATNHSKFKEPVSVGLSITADWSDE